MARTLSVAAAATIAFALTACEQQGPVSNVGESNLSAAPAEADPANIQPGANASANVEPACARPPANGAHLGGRRLSGAGHRITFTNGADADAIVKIRSASSRRLVSSFLVLRNSSAGLRGIPDGDYVVQYATGPGLAADCRTLARIDAAGEFPDDEPWATERERAGDSIRVRTVSNTYAIEAADGNVATTPIDPAAFNTD